MQYQLVGWNVPYATDRATYHKLTYSNREDAMRAFRSVCRNSTTWAQVAAMVDEKNGFLLADYTPRRGITWFGGGNND